MNTEKMLNETLKRATVNNWNISLILSRAAQYETVAYSADSTDEEIEWGAAWASVYYSVANRLNTNN